MFLSSIGERLLSETFDDGIACQFLRVLENNAASSSLQTFDLLLVLKTTAIPGDVTAMLCGVTVVSDDVTAMPGDVTVLQKR